MILSLALAAWLSPANAGGFEAKTMRAPLSSVEVERPPFGVHGLGTAASDALPFSVRVNEPCGITEGLTDASVGYGF